MRTMILKTTKMSSMDSVEQLSQMFRGVTLICEGAAF